MAAVGLVLIAAAIACAFVVNPEIAGTFAFLGFAAVVMSVFEPRMVGKFHLSPTSIDVTLVQRSVSDAESQLRDGSLRSLDEVI